MPRLSDDDIKKAFFELVNMTPSAIEQWLETDNSKSVGWDSGDGESVGHKSGRRIVQIKRKKRAELAADDIAHMRKVVGYIKRHRAQRWRYSLMNWGHDPLHDH